MEGEEVKVKFWTGAARGKEVQPWRGWHWEARVGVDRRRGRRGRGVRGFIEGGGCGGVVWLVGDCGMVVELPLLLFLVGALREVSREVGGVVVCVVWGCGDGTA